MDMPEIIEDVFMRATDFMHASELRMDEDHVGKPQDLYLGCSVGGAKNWGLRNRPLLFTSGCPCALRNPHYRVRALSLFRFTDTIIRGAILA